VDVLSWTPLGASAIFWMSNVFIIFFSLFSFPFSLLLSLSLISACHRKFFSSDDLSLSQASFSPLCAHYLITFGRILLMILLKSRYLILFFFFCVLFLFLISSCVSAQGTKVFKFWLRYFDSSWVPYRSSKTQVQ